MCGEALVTGAGIRFVGAGCRCDANKSVASRSWPLGGTKVLPKSAAVFSLTIPIERTWGSSTNIVTCDPACSVISSSALTAPIDPFDIEVWGKNIGWNDQAFGLDIAKPGQYYLTFGWDETPHVYSQKAQTLYNGIGTNNLTVPDSVRAALNGSIVGGLPTAASNGIVTGNSQNDRSQGSARHRERGCSLDAHRQLGFQRRLLAYAPRGCSGRWARFRSRRLLAAPPRRVQLSSCPGQSTTQRRMPILKANMPARHAWGKPFNVSAGWRFLELQQLL